MNPLSPALLIATANAFVGLGEDVKNPLFWPQGALVECFLKEVCAWRESDTRIPWDAAFVHHVGYWSHYDHFVERSGWPLPATANVEELAQYAGTSGALRECPLAGDVFLLWEPAERRFVRTGIVGHVLRRSAFSRGERCYQCVTIEGDSDCITNKQGTVTLRRERSFSAELGDRFIRWTSFDGREERREEIERDLDWHARVAAA